MKYTTEIEFLDGIVRTVHFADHNVMKGTIPKNWDGLFVDVDIEESGIWIYPEEREHGFYVEGYSTEITGDETQE